ncbi:MAG TPA: hypothetical protein PKA88_20110 [Polyangiaceae bacterium]|nr:hypothetical protein [Polyangiaceae bacterium]HMR73459.1 hypothetical protein [Polyangiaceae bacterium]
MRFGPLFLCCVSLGCVGCEDKKKPVPVEAPATTSAKPETPESTAEQPTVEALPPGVTAYPDADAPPAEREPRTGLCTFYETGYDGQDSRSTEKLIIKVKEDRIVGAKYSYRGSYALDGEREDLSMPLIEKQWLSVEMKMTSGTKTFEFKIKDDVMDVKGTAAKDGQGDCAWEDLDRKDKRRMRRK